MSTIRLIDVAYSLFDESFWFRVNPRVNYVYTSVSLEGLFNIVQTRPKQKFLLVLDAHREDEMRGLFLICGIEIELHLIHDGRIVLLNNLKDHTLVVYPYDPSAYAGQIEYTTLA